MIGEWRSEVNEREAKPVRKLHAVMNMLMLSRIDGCITGSSVAVVESEMSDVESWTSVPDVDVFCYSPEAQVAMIQYLRYGMDAEPGKGDDVSKKQERWKIDRCLSGQRSKDNPICSVTLTTIEGIKVNVTYKKNCTSMVKVLESFDMSIVMIGVDIKSMAKLDLRGEDYMTAVPNKLRHYDTSMWNVAHWIRQWDRVLKYYSRGFDTRPMAEFYLARIDACLAEGQMFTSEKYMQMYKEYTKEFLEMRERINEWMKEHADD